LDIYVEVINASVGYPWMLLVEMITFSLPKHWKAKCNKFWEESMIVIVIQVLPSMYSDQQK